MNYSQFQMPEQISEPMYSRGPMPVIPEPMPMPMPEPIPMPTEPMPLPMPEPVMPEYMKNPMPEPMPRPRSMPVIAPTPMVESEPEPHKHDHKHSIKLAGAFNPLWRRHMMWLHSLVISVVDGLPDVQLSSRRVSRNNSEILDCLKPCFSKDAAKSMAELLNQNLVHTVQLAQTAKGRKDIAELWEKLKHNTGHMMDTLKKGDHDINCEKLSREYAEYQELLKDEMTYKITKKFII